VRHNELNGIGERIAYVRGSKSQAEFAEEAGIHKNTLGNYERAEREMGALPLIRLVRLGWNANWLLTGEGPERLGAAVDKGLQASSQSAGLSASNVQAAAGAIAAVLSLRSGPIVPSVVARAIVALAADLDRRGEAKAHVEDILAAAARHLTTGSTEDGRSE
jgi:transcriptional regulator with XRE-family HTH domain